ncbi:hypothetical protein LAV79_19290 [Peribacillus butanolivorans]|uniref:hypothetical protein n=1 Tax=Peribacillus butanolivorans TaxID=421767 RepID=UPI0030C91BBA
MSFSVSDEMNLFSQEFQNYLSQLAVKEKENEINIRLAQEGEVPDFLATRAIKEGEAVYVAIKKRER